MGVEVPPMGKLLNSTTLRSKLCSPFTASAFARKVRVNRVPYAVNPALGIIAPKRMLPGMLKPSRIAVPLFSIIWFMTAPGSSCRYSNASVS